MVWSYLTDTLKSFLLGNEKKSIIPCRSIYQNKLYVEHQTSLLSTINSHNHYKLQLVRLGLLEENCFSYNEQTGFEWCRFYQPIV